MDVSLRSINSDYYGFQELISLYHEIKDCTDTTLDVNMSSVKWMDANMSASLGAALYRARWRFRRIKLVGMTPALREILQKNGFLPNFGFNREKKPDTNNTTIEYRRFERTDFSAFRTYVARHFVGKGIPNMTPALHSEFRKSISELFQNAVDHSRTKYGIFTCGQYFPRGNRLDFSVADLGIGMRRNIFDKANLDLAPELAIQWALEGHNTTRLPQDGRPGGLGLKLIRKFIHLNQGKIQIVSDAGYWTFNKDRQELRRFSSPFPGTVVNIEINTADTSSYCLASEIDSAGIF